MGWSEKATMNFGISIGVGFIVLLGIGIQNVVIGGRVTSTIFTLLVFPIFYYWSVRKKHLNI